MLELGLVDGDGALIEDNSFTVEDGTRLSSLSRSDRLLTIHASLRTKGRQRGRSRAP